MARFNGASSCAEINHLQIQNILLFSQARHFTFNASLYAGVCKGALAYCWRNLTEYVGGIEYTRKESLKQCEGISFFFSLW